MHDTTTTSPVDVALAERAPTVIGEPTESNPYCIDVWEVTPDLARDLLDRVPDYQRNLRPRKVEQFARDILSGEWVLTHQAIAIDEDGKTADGRHRCAAVVMANRSIRSYVAIGVPKSVYRFIDAGSPRRVSEVTDLDSYEAALIRAIVRHTFGWGDIQLSNSELVGFFEKHKGSLTAVCGAAGHRIGGFARTTAEMNAALWRGFVNMPFNQWVRLSQLLWGSVPPEDVQPGDGSVRLLRDYVLAGADKTNYRRQVSARESKRIRYAKTERAVRAFLEGRDVAKLYAGDATELFIVPELDDNAPGDIEGR
jgi:hypothetical protein